MIEGGYLLPEGLASRMGHRPKRMQVRKPLLAFDASVSGWKGSRSLQGVELLLKECQGCTGELSMSWIIWHWVRARGYCGEGSWGVVASKNGGGSGRRGPMAVASTIGRNDGTGVSSSSWLDLLSGLSCRDRVVEGVECSELMNRWFSWRHWRRAICWCAEEVWFLALQLLMSTFAFFYSFIQLPLPHSLFVSYVKLVNSCRLHLFFYIVHLRCCLKKHTWLIEKLDQRIFKRLCKIPTEAEVWTNRCQIIINPIKK